MEHLEDYFFTKNTRYFLWGGFALLFLLLTFHAGVEAGSQQARGMRGLPRMFMPGGHGAVGTISTIALPLITLTSREGNTLTIDASTSTIIVGTASSDVSSLSIGQTIIVIGDPDETDNSGAVNARLIRVLPVGAPQQ